MKKKVLYWGVSAIFYILYFQILRMVWNAWVPWHIVTDVLALFILIIVNIPLSIITTEKIFTWIQEK